MISRQLDDAVTERLKSERRERERRGQLELRPVTLETANFYIKRWHRHHKTVQGAKFAISAWRDGELVGIAVCGRPVAREVSPLTAEVTRLATDGSNNVCSFLYAACARACQAMGYTRIQTYILEEEPGTTLRAAGWEFEQLTQGGDWNHSKAYAGKRRTDQPMGR